MNFAMVTDKKPRSILCGRELPESARKDFDYLNDAEYVNNDFVEYKGRYYVLAECIATNHPVMKDAGWDFCIPCGDANGICFRFADLFTVVVGRYHCWR